MSKINNTLVSLIFVWNGDVPSGRVFIDGIREETAWEHGGGFYGTGDGEIQKLQDRLHAMGFRAIQRDTIKGWGLYRARFILPAFVAEDLIREFAPK